MNVLDLAQRNGRQYRKASATNGGEWHGPCPGCGGDDRFHIWPAENEGQGGYWCRGCGKFGDAIQFLRDFEGRTYFQACAELGIKAKDVPGRGFGAIRHPGAAPPAIQSFTPAVAAAPADLWCQKAKKFVSWAAENLAKDHDQLAWLAGRGISPETASRFRLGWNPGEGGKDLYRPRKVWGLEEVLREDGRPKALWIPRGLVIPLVKEGQVQRIRIRRPEGEPRYYVLPGSSPATMILEPQRRAFVVVEAELDAIACAAAQESAGAVGLGSVAAKPDAEAYQLLQRALQILNALDYDAAGAKTIGSGWWEQQFDRCDRWPVPRGKDPGDAARLGIDLKSWIQAGLPPALTIGGEAGAEENRPERQITGDSGKEPEKPGMMEGVPAAIIELRDLLRKNPGVKIVNTPERYTVHRGGKFVSGRIGELVFRCPEVMDYISLNPAREIDAGNLIRVTA
jgi:hypothetical protein